MAARTGQVRIIGGKWKRRKLRFPVISGLRPTPSRLRETAFAWIGSSIEGARCLDLCAGSGALGVESLSRGAEFVDFVERDRRARTALAAGLEAFGAQNSRIWGLEAHKFVKLAAERAQTWDIVFLDPPFAGTLLTSLLPQAFALLASEDSLLCVKHSKRTGLPEGPWQRLRSSSSGESSMSLIARPPVLATNRTVRSR